MGKLGGEMKALAKHCGGSHKTVNDRIHIVQRFDHHLRALNVQIQRVAQIKVRHIESYAVQQGLTENNPAQHLEGVTAPPVKNHYPALP
ncbi:phage integrase N-terminal domain-containing protein, partial [Salmonella enterica]